MGDGRLRKYRNLHDVWYSTDGITWTQATSGAGWSARDGLSSATLSDTIWVLGGEGAGSPTDLWYAGAPPAPVAAFSGTPTSGTAPLTVQFTDGSTGTPTSWAWDFNNDGTTDSTVQNPSYSYSTAGTYSVKLTATNAGGSNSLLRSAYINVTSPETTALSFQPVTASVNTGATTDYAVVLSSSPLGLSGYNITVALGNSSIGTITNVVYLSWTTTIKRNSTTPAGTIWIRGVGPTSQTTNITLCTITVQGSIAGTSGLTVTSTKINDGSGGLVTTTPGSLTVIAVQPIVPFPGQTLAPTDPNGDGLYEDINGNGAVDYTDVTLYFDNMEYWIGANEPILPFDYNGNGAIDYDDLNLLFDMV